MEETVGHSKSVNVDGSSGNGGDKATDLRRNRLACHELGLDVLFATDV